MDVHHVEPCMIAHPKGVQPRQLRLGMVLSPQKNPTGFYISDRSDGHRYELRACFETSPLYLDIINDELDYDLEALTAKSLTNS